MVVLLTRKLMLDVLNVPQARKARHIDINAVDYSAVVNVSEFKNDKTLIRTIPLASDHDYA